MAETKVSTEEVAADPAGDGGRGQQPPGLVLYLDCHTANPFLSLQALLTCPLLRVS